MGESPLTKMFLTMFLIMTRNEELMLTSSEGCQHKTINNSGTFTSPQLLSDNYPDFQYCSWLITVNATLVVSLNFALLSIPDCNGNSLNIYDGANDTSPLLARYCGSNATANATVISSKNNLYMVFIFGNDSRNNSGRHLGFYAEYRAQLKPNDFTIDLSDKHNSSLTALIAFSILALGIFIIIVIIVTMFCWRRKKQGNGACNSFKVVNGINPAYEMRTKVSEGKGLSSSFIQELAFYLSPQERIWHTNDDGFCKESQNPVYETAAAYMIYRCSENITYETSDGMIGNDQDNKTRYI